MPALDPVALAVALVPALVLLALWLCGWLSPGETGSEPPERRDA